MAYKVIILYQLYMPSYFLGTFTEYPYLSQFDSDVTERIIAGTMESFTQAYKLYNAIPDMKYSSENASVLFKRK